MSAPQGPSRAGVAQMFDRIAGRYDVANRVLSGGLDVRWRRRLLARLPQRDGLRVLDVATGTADLALALARDPRVTDVVGVDVSAGMLAVGRDKVARDGLSGRITLTDGDATDLSDYRGAFDVVTIAFGIRNVRDTVAGLRGMAKTLKPGGTLLVLEFAEPSAPVIADVYRAYRRHLLPRVGGLIAGDTSAYRYLDDTIKTFPAGEDFAQLVRDAGLIDVGFETMTFGAVQLTWAHAPAQEMARA